MLIYEAQSMNQLLWCVDALCVHVTTRPRGISGNRSQARPTLVQIVTLKIFEHCFTHDTEQSKINASARKLRHGSLFNSVFQIC